MYIFQASSRDEIAAIPISKVLSQLNNAGVVLFRGFATDLSRYEDFTRSLCDHFHSPSARASMRFETSDGFSTHVPEFNFVLLIHSEGAYIPHPFPPHKMPEIACFYCLVPPMVSGGQTILVDGVQFLKQLPADLRDRFHKDGIIYEALWDEERYREEFPVKDKDALTHLLDGIDGFDYQFEDDQLHFRYKTPAVTQTMTGLPTFSTGLLAHLPRFDHPRYADKIVYTKPSNRVYFGDGEEISDAVINMLVDIQDDILMAHDWQANDVVLIDNTRFMHGRNMTEKDCERRIFSRFGVLK